MKIARPLVVLALAALMLLSASPQGHAHTTREGAADSMIGLINQARQRRGLPRLTPSNSLKQTSFRFAQSLMARHVLAHRSRPSTSRSYTLSGEALALVGPGDQARTTLRRWLASPPHRAVILNRSVRELGAGLVHGRFRGYRSVIWVVQVGKR